jgi:hypothetical protein
MADGNAPVPAGVELTLVPKEVLDALDRTNAWLTEIIKAIAKKDAEITQAVALASLTQVTDAATMAEVNEWCVALLTERDALELGRGVYVKPFKSVGSTIDAAVKIPRDKIDVCVPLLKQRIGAYLQAEKARQAAEYAKAVEAHQAGNHTQAVASLTVASAATTSAPVGTGMREEWVATVINATMVTPEWTTPDLAKIQAHARATALTSEPFPIPGVKFEKKPILSVRR